ncbi:MAG: P-loop NTPase [Candidatus Omnitrophica bacterium]|nr:P-loop NTPase [Candidatus Omnitrophota bacterium]
MIKYIVPVASGKGGVGKSTVSVNLAVALAQRGHRVGLMDADVYGPSVPTLLGTKDKPLVRDNKRILPVEKYGVKMISMGFFIPVNEAVIWRGPMLHKMVQDFLGAVEWGDLDFLVVDLPPGTGDIQLSLCQSAPVSGAVIVSTPQDVAWSVAQKAIMMFDKLNAPVAGIIENMSGEIFGRGGARRAAEALNIPFLGEIPLDKALRETSDRGEPIVMAAPKNEAAQTFLKIAQKLADQLKKGLEGQTKVPSKISDPGGPRIEIDWSDGKKSIFETRDLRLNCPCAACVHEITGQRILNPASVPAGVAALTIKPVGRYALHIAWSDGHSTGLYGYGFLRKLSKIA